MKQVIRAMRVALLFISVLSIFCFAVQSQQPPAFQIGGSEAIKITTEKGAKLELLSKTAKIRLEFLFRQTENLTRSTSSAASSLE